MYLEHANITVPNIQSTVEFLTVAFPEFKVRGSGRTPSGEGNWLHFGNDDFYMALQDYDQLDNSGAPGYHDNGVNHLGWVVKDLAALVQRLEQAGYGVYQSAEHPSRDRSYFFDGNGLEWEFIQYKSDDPNIRNDYSS